MNLKKACVPVLVMFLAGCSGDDAGDDSVVAKVGDKTITSTDVERYMKLKGVPAQDEKRAAHLLDDYLEREAIALKAEGSQYVDQKLLDVEVNEFRKQLLISRYFENFLNEKVGEDAIQNYYNTHPEEYQVEQAKVAHVLIRTHDNMSEEERRARLTLAQEAFAKAKTDITFDEVVSQYSEDTVSAKQGGVIGWVKRGAIDKVFSERVFAMQAGELSEPFATPFGYHVVKLLESPQVVKTPFEKVKGDIRYRLRQQAKTAEMDRLLASVEISK